MDWSSAFLKFLCSRRINIQSSTDGPCKVYGSHVPAGAMDTTPLFFTPTVLGVPSYRKVSQYYSCCFPNFIYYSLIWRIVA